MSVFTTSDGTVLTPIPRYRQVAPPMTAHDVLAEHQEMARWQIGIDPFIKDLYEYALVIDALDTLSVPTRWNRALDIGGAEGTMAAHLQKGNGGNS